MIYEDFTLSFRRGDGLKIRASSASGEATTPIDAEKLRALGRTIAEALDPRPWRDTGAGGTPDRLRELGTALFSLIFSGPVAETFNDGLGRQSRSPSRPLRLRVGFEPEEPELAWLEDLAWELLFCPRLEGFLALDRRFSIVRALPVPQAVPPSSRQKQLLCLGVVSAPRGERDIHPNMERREIERSLQGISGLRFESLPAAVAGTLRRRLIEGHSQVLHFMGHGYREEEHGHTVFGLVLEDGYGDRLPVDSRDWADLISDTDLRLVVLNTCRSAERNAADGAEPFHGVAQRLVRAGLPAVIAMRQVISELGARAFSPELYRRLGAGDPIDAAMVEARKAMKRSGAPLAEWAVPALFLRGAGEELFHIGPEDIHESPPRRQLASGIHIGDLKTMILTASAPEIGVDKVEANETRLEGTQPAEQRGRQ